MGHRVFRHESKCAHVHGHNYVGWFTAFSPSGLDLQGRVIDFGVLKYQIGAWIQEFWDHGMVLAEKDPLVKVFEDIKVHPEMDPDPVATATGHPSHGQKLFLLPKSPTAENLALYLLNVVCPSVLRGTGVWVTKVVLEETENCSAEVSVG